jgi:succinate dehydrogenase/fumarate reductase flavoprotein subunit
MSHLEEDVVELKTDVLVIGGGPAAAWAAIAARERGAEVVVVDKGYVGASGAFAASTAGYKVVPPISVLRDPVKFERYAMGGFLAQHRWWDRLLEITYDRAPRIWAWAGYDIPVWERTTKSSYRSLQGSETMRILRDVLIQKGVKLLDQSPALELLVDHEGTVAGARGISRRNNVAAPWSVKAGATVVASGGVAWLSKALGCNTNTGDLHLAAAEVGAELSGMEFSAHYCMAPVHSTVTKGAYYRYATFYAEDGTDLTGVLMNNGHRSTSAVAKQLMKGPVYAQLDKGTDDPDVRRMLHLGQPNFFAAFYRAGIDPFAQRFPITLVLEGTVRGTGGVRIADDECGTTVPGLYAAGDAATRELNCGGFTGGGGPNMTWAIGSGNIAGRAAADFARSLGKASHERATQRTGRAGLRPNDHTSAFDAQAVIKGVQAEVLPFETNIFRTAKSLTRSLSKLEWLWGQVQGIPQQDTAQHLVRSREAAALVATARWSYFAGLARTETRGMHKRLDHPTLDPSQRHYLRVGGLSKLWTRADAVPEEVVQRPKRPELVVAAVQSDQE